MNLNNIICIEGGGIHKCLCGFVGGVAKCPCLSTRGEGGVKNGPKSVYVVYGSPLKVTFILIISNFNYKKVV